LKIEKNTNSVSQDFPNQTMLIMPEVPDPNVSHAKTFSQLRADRFNPLPQPTASPSELRGMDLGHAFANRGDKNNPLSFFEQGLTKSINEGFIGWD